MEECDEHHPQNHEAVLDWFGVVMLRAIRMSKSHIGGASVCACSAKSVGEECCAAKFIWFLQLGVLVLSDARVPSRRLLEICVEFCLRE